MLLITFFFKVGPSPTLDVGCFTAAAFKASHALMPIALVASTKLREIGRGMEEEFYAFCHTDHYCTILGILYCSNIELVHSFVL